MITTILLFPAIVSLVAMALNVIAVHYDTIGALPFPGTFMLKFEV